MALDVPEPIAAYLAAERTKDADALSRCFIEDGTVNDEGQYYRVRVAIHQVTVHARLTGQFLGSPIELDIFRLSNGKIASLEIRS